MFDSIRRRLGLHVHDWEPVDTHEVDVEEEVRESAGSGRALVEGDPQLITVPIEIATFKCRTCGKVKESRVRVG